MTDVSVGATVAGCRLEAVAGRGGMGVVFRATQLALGRPVAVKAISPQFAEDPAFRERFQREAQLAASIDHPNVIPVYEAGEHDGALLLIMRWVEGTELRAVLRDEGRLAPDRAVRLLRPVASALHAAHRRGLVHRDVKPANVLITSDDEHVYLTDFGIARRLDSDAGVTRTGALVGTLDYVAPERIEGARGDAASDIYSLGCVLYEALVGEVPFARSTELAKMHAHVHDPPPSPRERVPAVPPALDAIVRKAMAKDPAERFASAAALASALDEVVARTEEADTAETTVPEAERPTQSLPPRAGPPRRRRGMWIGAGVAAAAVALLAVVLLAGGGGGGGEKPTPAAKTTASTAAAPAPATARASGQARVDPRPAFTVSGGRLAGMVEAGGRLWVAQPSRGRLVGLAAGKPAVTAAVGGAPADLAADARGRVWAAGTGARRLTVFDPATSRRTPVATGPRPGGVVMTGGAAWVANRGASSLTRIDAATLTPRAIALPARPQTLVAAYGRVWAVLSGGAVRAFRGDGTPDPLASPPAAGAAMGGGPSHGVWIAGAIAGGRTQLTRIDPRAEVARTSGGTKTYDAPAPPAPLPGAPRGFVAEDDAIWLAAGGAVTRLDTQGDARAVGKVTLPADAGALAQRDGGLWAAVPSSGRIYRLAP